MCRETRPQALEGRDVVKLRIDDVVMCDTSGKHRNHPEKFKLDRMEGVIVDVPTGAIIKYIVDVGLPSDPWGFHDSQLTKIGRL